MLDLTCGDCRQTITGTVEEHVCPLVEGEFPTVKPTEQDAVERLEAACGHKSCDLQTVLDRLKKAEEAWQDCKNTNAAMNKECNEAREQRATLKQMGDKIRALGGNPDE